MKIRIDPLDTLFSEYIRRRSKGYCQRCGRYYGWQSIQCCHFHSRRKRSVRWDEDNAAALDFGCHSYLDGNPIEKIEWFKQHLGEEKFDMLNSRARTPARYLDKSAIEIYLRQKISELVKENNGTE